MNVFKFTALIIVLINLMMSEKVFSQASDKVSNTPATQGMIKIESGKFKHFFKKGDEDSTEVKSFYLDIYAVTNAEYLEFVKSNPEWARSKVSRLFAEKNYLKHWDEDFVIQKNTTQLNNSPVTNISWFAANAYALYIGKRLPTIIEWEYAASSEIEKSIEEKSLTNTQIILSWYSKPTPTILPNIGSAFKNKWGVHDMHGLIWEWVFDFNNNIVQGDSRDKDSIEKELFCGAAGNKATDKEDYASFMRYGYRESLKGSYTVANLGFRCAKDLEQNK